MPADPVTDSDLAEVARRRPPPSIIDGAIRLLREAWRDDGAEGESVHLLCREVEALRVELAALRAAVVAATEVPETNSTADLVRLLADWSRTVDALRKVRARPAPSGDVEVRALRAIDVVALVASVDCEWAAMWSDKRDPQELLMLAEDYDGEDEDDEMKHRVAALRQLATIAQAQATDATRPAPAEQRASTGHAAQLANAVNEAHTALQEFTESQAVASNRGAIPAEVRAAPHGVDCSCPACRAQTAGMADYAARRAAGEGGHGMVTVEPDIHHVTGLPWCARCEAPELCDACKRLRWHPKPGDRVRTVEVLTGSGDYNRAAVAVRQVQIVPMTDAEAQNLAAAQDATLLDVDATIALTAESCTDRTGS